ncbi:MAG: amidohydrolase family protein [Armatimonadota bacterium]
MNPSPIAQEFLSTGRSAGCPIIDMHGHFGPASATYLPMGSAERMLHSMQRAGVTQIACSAHEALFGDTDGGNALMQAAIDAHPEQLLGYWAVNPNLPEQASRAGEDLVRARGFVGFKCLPDYHTHPITGDGYRSALEYADAHRLLVLVHTWGGSPFNSPQQVAEVAARYPGATFLMGHSGYGDWEASTAIARDLPNAYLELTAVYVAHDFGNQPGGSGTPLPLLSCLHVNGIIEYMVERAGSQKILFGTDLPWYSPHYAAGSILFAHISDDARHDILHRNAERLLAGKVNTHAGS